MTTLTVQAKDRKHLSKIKLVLKAVDADFKENNDDLPSEKFIKRLEEARENYKNGDYKVLTDDYKKELFGL